MSPFTPLGEQARWRVIYDLLRTVPVDGVLTYAAMGEALGLHPDNERHILQVSMRRAAKELLEIDKHAVTPVINTGYRVVRAVEHYDLARRHQRRSNKELVKAKGKVSNVDWQALTPESRKVFEVVAQALVAQSDFCRRLDIRQSRLEGALQAINAAHGERAQRTEEELAALKERLAALEARG